MFLKLASLFRKLFTELLQFIYCCCSTMCTQTSSPACWPSFLPVAIPVPHRSATWGALGQLLSARSAGHAAIQEVFSPVQYAMLPGTMDLVFNSTSLQGVPLEVEEWLCESHSALRHSKEHKGCRPWSCEPTGLWLMCCPHSCQTFREDLPTCVKKITFPWPLFYFHFSHIPWN